MRAEIENIISEIHKSLELLKQRMDWETAEHRMEEFDAMSENPDLWNNPEKAQKLMRERQMLSDSISNFKELSSNLHDNIELIELGEIEEDHEIIKEAENGILIIQKEYTRKYLIVADVARGDSKDYSAFHIIDVEEAKQIGEFKGQIGTKEFGHMLVAIATEYNNALLVVENANIGWNTIQVVIDKGYQNLYYSPKGDAATNAEAFLAKGYDITDTTKMVPGFTMSMKTRPLTIGKLDAYLREKSVIIQGQRTMEEMRTFIWKNGRAEAQTGYNDDLVMSLATGCYVRDTALKFAQQGIDLTKATLRNLGKSAPSIYTGGTTKKDAGWSQDMGEHGQQDLTWLL